jgi:MoaA/NifB/PqqE/SkfB family radical SAM enzyme
MEKERDFYLQGSDADKERFSGSFQVNFEWNMLYACNYRCSHCVFAGKWEEYGPRTVYLSPDEWMKHWKKVYDLYGRVSMVISGGEPFIYPDFVALIEKISGLHYPLNISTNSSGDLAAFVRRIDPKRVSLTLSFQPEFDSLDDVLTRAEFLNKHGFNSEYINFCAYPPYLKRLENYVKRAMERGHLLKVIPFYGTYEGNAYPDGYSAENKKLLGIDSAWEHNVKRKGTLCAAGQKSALLYPDGKVARCGQIGERALVGNLFSPDFTLLSRPKVCDVELCPCLKAVAADELKGD